MKINTIQCKTLLTKSRLPEADYCINPYVGCLHGCIYCYGRFMKRFTGHDEPWGNFLDIKINAPEVLAKELARKPKIEAFLEIELKNPDSKKVFYLNKEEIIKGPPADYHDENASFSKRFKFIADKPGQYTLTIIPYNYGIVSIDVRVRDIK